MSKTDPFDEAVKWENVSPEVVIATSEALDRFRAEHELDPGDWQIRIFPSGEPRKLALWIGGPPQPTIKTCYEIDADGDLRAEVLSKLEIHRNSN
jgi:hypothetical protein